MNIGVTENGIIWYKLAEGEFLLKLQADSSTEFTISLDNATMEDVERIEPMDFFNKRDKDEDN
jgi:hypothetical protein